MMSPLRNTHVENRAARGAGGADQLQAAEEEGDHHGGEDREEDLDPQVDHPPAPVLGHRQVGVLSDAEARYVARGDGEASSPASVWRAALSPW
jgi:hypothetical protein